MFIGQAVPLADAAGRFRRWFLIAMILLGIYLREARFYNTLGRRRLVNAAPKDCRRPSPVGAFVPPDDSSGGRSSKRRRQRSSRAAAYWMPRPIHAGHDGLCVSAAATYPLLDLLVQASLLRAPAAVAPLATRHAVAGLAGQVGRAEDMLRRPKHHRPSCPANAGPPVRRGLSIDR